MNHIAHFLLAPHTEQGTVGTLLADFYRGPISIALPDEIVTAIALHRAIDSHTDRHPATGEAKSLFAPGLRRYAGVALDLYFDHCLVREWDQYVTTSFAAFVDATYERLTSGLDAAYVPDRMRRMARAMRTEDWLGAYQDFDGVERALGRLNHAIRHRFEGKWICCRWQTNCGDCGRNSTPRSAFCFPMLPASPKCDRHLGQCRCSDTHPTGCWRLEVVRLGTASDQAERQERHRSRSIGWERRVPDRIAGPGPPNPR